MASHWLPRHDHALLGKIQLAKQDEGVIGVQVIPVDDRRLGACMVVVPPGPKTDPAGQQRTDREGRPQWVVGVAVRDVETRRAEVLEITLTAPAVPEMEPGAWVRLEDLEAVQWSIDGRSGVSWRARGVHVSGAAAKRPAGGEK
ncbi:hypothetical protein ACL02R_29400 [Streptomyces sp. MS19]|uniref:hypothetical protein n=1 Tax=Streptomyces sp. MS19 TaxID=3385972 RepID=UPI0039A38E8F